MGPEPPGASTTHAFNLVFGLSRPGPGQGQVENALELVRTDLRNVSNTQCASILHEFALAGRSDCAHAALLHMQVLPRRRPPRPMFRPIECSPPFVILSHLTLSGHSSAAPAAQSARQGGSVARSRSWLFWSASALITVVCLAVFLIARAPKCGVPFLLAMMRQCTDRTPCLSERGSHARSAVCVCVGVCVAVPPLPLTACVTVCVSPLVCPRALLIIIHP